MEFIDQFWSGFIGAMAIPPLFLALATAGVWADRHFGKSEEVRLAIALLLGFAIGLGLTYLDIPRPFEIQAWMFAVPLILLGLILAFQSSVVSSQVALIVLLLIGLFFGYGQPVSQGSIPPTTVGVACGALMSFTSGVGLGTILSAVIGSFVLRLIGIAVLIAGGLMVVDVNQLL